MRFSLFTRQMKPHRFKNAPLSATVSGSVYTNLVTFVTASISMRLHHPFTRHRSRLLSKPRQVETGTKSVTFSKRCGRVNSETASIWRHLLFWREICIVQFTTVNLASSAALAYAIMTWNFWRKRFRVNTYKPHRFWRGFEVGGSNLQVAGRRSQVIVSPIQKVS